MELNKGDALYAKRAGNKTFAWYVVDEARVAPFSGRYPVAMAHREHGVGRPEYMLFTDVKHVDVARY